MIDTIILRIHNLEEHSSLVTKLHKKGLEGQSQFTRPVDVTESMEGFKKRTDIHNYFTDHVKGIDIEKAYRNHLPSYHYDIAYAIYFAQDYIEFNLSIPKYLYGTNIFQFVPHSLDDEYLLYYGADSFHEIKSNVYDRLKRFIRWFIKRELGENFVNEYYLQVCQIDICYNKFFHSKEDVKAYLGDLKRVKKKYLRDTSEKSSYMTGIHLNTSDYAFKIYHKGPEFSLHDKRKLKKIWPKKFVDELQTVSDRILRFELSLRNGLINTLFKDFIFRKNDEVWRVARKYFRQISSNGYIVDANNNKTEFLDMKKNQKQLYKYAKHIENRTFHFMLASDSAYHVDTENQDHEIKSGKYKFDREMRFSKVLFLHCFKKFVQYFDEFNVNYEGDIIDLIQSCERNTKTDAERLKNFHDLILRLGNSVKGVERQISWSTIKMVEQLLRTSSWDEIRRSGLMNDRKYFRVKKAFKLVGITNPATVMIPDTKNDFKEYFQTIDSLKDSIYVKDFLRRYPF